MKAVVMSMTNIIKAAGGKDKPITIGNMEYSLCEDFRGEVVPAYRYKNDIGGKFMPIYDEQGLCEFGWSDFGEVCRIFDVIDKYIESINS